MTMLIRLSLGSVSKRIQQWFSGLKKLISLSNNNEGEFKFAGTLFHVVTQGPRFNLFNFSITPLNLGPSRRVAARSGVPVWISSWEGNDHREALGKIL